MSGFVTNAVGAIPGHAETVMSCFNENTLPVLSQLAREYALFDAWHASVPGNQLKPQNTSIDLTCVVMQTSQVSMIHVM